RVSVFPAGPGQGRCRERGGREGGGRGRAARPSGRGRACADRGARDRRRAAARTLRTGSGGGGAGERARPAAGGRAARGNRERPATQPCAEDARLAWPRRVLTRHALGPSRTVTVVRLP